MTDSNNEPDVNKLFNRDDLRAHRIADQRAAEVEHERDRRQLWIQVATAVARADSAKDKEAPGRWANKALDDFDREFDKRSIKKLQNLK